MKTGEILARLQGVRSLADGSHMAKCPAHDDKKQSLHVTPADSGRTLIKCHAGCSFDDICRAIGLEKKDFMDPEGGFGNGAAHQPALPPPPDYIKPVQNAPQSSPRFEIEKIYDYKDAAGVLVYQAVRLRPKDFRQRRPDPARHGKWLWNLQGVQRVLYRLPDVIQAVRDGRPVYVVEGEKDADNLSKMGLCATTNAGGAGKWEESFTDTLSGADVVILPDNDDPGRKHADVVSKSLDGKARSIKIFSLPGIPPKGDVSDWIEAGGDSEKLSALVDAAPLWTSTTAPMTPPLSLVLTVPDEAPITVTLAQSGRSEYSGHSVQVEAVVSAKDIAPYIVPSEFIIRCRRDKKFCGFCPVGISPTPEVHISIGDRHQALLELIDIPIERVRGVLKKAVGIPKPCDSFSFEETGHVNIEEVRLMPPITIGAMDTDHAVRRAFHVGMNLETNTSYKLTARVLPEPKTQYATLLIYEAAASVDSLSQFSLTPQISDSLKIFQPAAWTLAGMKEKLSAIYTDLASNVTRIYSRDMLHTVIDLAYHSPLYMTFQGRVMKGWIEVLIMGDSGQGKSEATGKLRDFYGLGEKVDAKGASVSGLIGGLQESGKRWFVSWGVITLNDRRLVILEEIKGMDQAVIGKLTEARSSGVAEVSKIEKARTNARTRLIWISNPRSDRRLLSYNYGVEAVKELIGALEDIRRFDLALLVASGEVPSRLINIPESDRPVCPHVYTRNLCQALILWAWSRPADGVQFDSDATAEILRVAEMQGKTFSATIPLVEAADQRLKLARISASLAARTYSHEGESIRVRVCHVDYAMFLINKIYSGETMGYLDYSKKIFSESVLRDPEDVRAKILLLRYSKDVIRSWLESNFFTPADVVDWTGETLEEARELVGFLVRKNAARRGKRGYMKTVAFITLLKELEKSGMGAGGGEI